MSDLLTPQEQRNVQRYVVLFLSQFVNRKVTHDQTLNWILQQQMTKRESVAFVLYMVHRYGMKGD